MKFLNNDEIVYEDLLAKFLDYFNTLVIRHDVDHSLKNALRMAEYEKKLGVSSYYMLRHPLEKSNYYGTVEDGVILRSNDLLDSCKELVRLGHQIGFHYSTIAYSILYQTNPAKLITSELNWFRGNSIPVNMVSPHGSASNYEKAFIEYEIFQECDPRRFECWGQYGRRVEGIPLNSLSMKELDVEDFYFTPFQGYFSDSGGKFVKGYIRNEYSYFEPQVRGMQSCKISEEIPEIDVEILSLTDMNQKGIYDSCQLLIHPCWWN